MKTEEEMLEIIDESYGIESEYSTGVRDALDWILGRVEETPFED